MYIYKMVALRLAYGQEV